MSKTFVGVRLRQLRTERGLSQASLAKTLEISASYLNQIEHDVRPLTVPVLLRISEVFGVDTTFFSPQDDTRLIAEMREVALDQEMGIDADAHEIAEMVSTHPGLAKAMVNMHRRFRNTTAQLAAATEDRFSDGSGSGSITMPHEEVRDYFYQRQNYIHDLDTAAEELTARMRFHRGDVAGEIARRLESVHDVQIVRRVDLGENILHRYDPDTRVLEISARLSGGQQVFKFATELAYLEHGDLLDSLVAEGNFTSEASVSLAKLGLANYFAAATVLPYSQFHEVAEDFRYDIERMSAFYSASYETICHRLSTCSAPNFAGFRSCSCVSIVPETCRSVSPPPDSTSLPAAVRARCGTSTRRSRIRARSCLRSRRCPTVVDTSGLRARSNVERLDTDSPQRSSPSDWDARFDTPTDSSTATVWIWTSRIRERRSARAAVSANASIVRSVPSLRWVKTSTSASTGVRFRRT